MTREKALALIIDLAATYVEEEEERRGFEVTAEMTDDDLERNPAIDRYEFVAAQKMRDVLLALKTINETVR